MRYAVRWSRRALDALTEIWLANPDQRAAINQATANTDQLFSVAPGEQGESRDAGRRIFFVPPLVVIFNVDDVHRVVRVLNIRFLKRRTDG